MTSSSTFTSKYFEENVGYLRAEVSRFIERGICIVDHEFKPASVLNSMNLVYTLCKEVAKARGKPFVSVEFIRGAGRDSLVRVTIPLKCKVLTAQIFMLGVESKLTGQHPICFQKKGSNLITYYNGERARGMFDNWLHMCQTDKQMRFTLGLPTIVTRPSVTSGGN
jgi:hypothetical protein